jgi:gamma-glutamylcyclotransferase (GGCT)/AIG2-like uncharacterized protein YtfP
MNTEEHRLLFVYGTLMSGFYNHRHLEHPGVRFIGEARTTRGYGMAASGIPFMYRLPDHFDSTAARLSTVKGELYSVPSWIIEGPIDALEGHPNHYRRQPVYVGVEGAPMVVAEAYLAPYRTIEHLRAVPSGDFRKCEQPYWAR